MRIPASLRHASALLVLVFATLASLPAQDTAWAWVEPANAGSTFTPLFAYQHSSTGGTITVSRVPGTLHRYSVTFPGFNSSTGIVVASAYGGDHTVVVDSWGLSLGGVQANVSVYGSSGGPANNEAFTISYRLPGITRSAQLWANLPSASGYTPSTTYSWNGNRPDPTIQRVSAGNYRVWLPGLDAPFADKGHVQVTTYGNLPRRTKVQGWQVIGSDTRVDVRTYDMSGQPADSMFTLVYNEYAAPIRNAEGSGAHVWADQPTVASYVPDPDYTDSNGREGPKNAERVQRLGTGSYVVDLPDCAPSASATALVSGYGFDQSYATITAWGDNGCGGTRVWVATHAPNGALTDARFLLSFVTNRPAQRREQAWAWVDPVGQGSSFVPSPTYQYSSSGLQVSVERDPVQQNRFRVDFPGFGSSGGTVHATAYGGNHTAVVNGWSRVGTTIRAWIELFTPSGAPANDGRFTVHWRRIGNWSNREAYLFAQNPNATNYTPDTFFSWNANRGDPTITRTSTGVYSVRLPGLAQTTTGGHVQVTPYGPDLLRAKVSAWAPNGDDMVAVVRVFDGSGTPINGRFMLSYNEVAAPIGVEDGSGAHVWANASAPAAPYTPTPFYSDSNGIVGQPGPIVVTRTSTGVYEVELPELDAFDSSFAQVTAYGADAKYASLTGWNSNGAGGTRVFVRTYGANGAASDSRFNLLYLTSSPAIPIGAATNVVYGAGCGGLSLQANTLPLSCLTWELDVNNFPTGALFGFVQLDLTQSGTPLGPIAPGCTVLTGGAVTDVFTNLSSPVDYALEIPSAPIFLGLDVYAQGGAWVPGFNSINIALSNGVRGTVGNR